MKDKLKSYSFWVSLLGTIGIIVQSILKEFGIAFNQQALDSVITGICGILVLFGVCSAPVPKKEDLSTKDGLDDTQDN